ncbi:MAG TPA: hypothetical protein PLI97_01620 [Fluviicola sp.]|nr:hypothetical protein [Fluviicola sp.]
MKKVSLLLVLAMYFLAPMNSNAQAFSGKGSTYLQLGFGMAYHSSGYRDYDRIYNYRYNQFNFQMEFGVHQYVGLGFMIAPEIGSRYNGYYVGYYYPGYNYPKYSPYWSVGIPVSFIVNFHFLNLIADKQGGSYTDKLDVYAGLSVGSGPVFRRVHKKYDNGNYYGSRVGFLLFAGPHLGIRFFPVEKVGIYAEFGYGKSVITGGVAFKL